MFSRKILAAIDMVREDLSLINSCLHKLQTRCDQLGELGPEIVLQPAAATESPAEVAVRASRQLGTYLGLLSGSPVTQIRDGLETCLKSLLTGEEVGARDLISANVQLGVMRGELRQRLEGALMREVFSQPDHIGMALRLCRQRTVKGEAAE